MRKIVGVLIVFIVIAIIFVRNNDTEGDYVVRVGHLQIMASKLPFQVAVERGFFEEEGIKIKATELQTSNLLLDALVRGDIDITPEIALFPFMSAELADPGKLKIFSVTDLEKENPFDVILVKEESKIKLLTDLAGKKIGVSPGTTATNMLRLFLNKKGIDTSAIQFIQLAPAVQLQGLSSGSVDALFAYDPLIAIAKTQNMRQVFGSVFSDLVDHSPLGGGLISNAFIKQHPVEAAKAVRAINKAYDFMKVNPAETRKIMAKTFNITDPIVIEAVSLTPFVYLDKIDMNVFEKFVQSTIEAGELKAKPDLTNVFYK